MELLEIQDPEKKKLVEASERHRRELDREVNEISERTEKVVKNALIIGGALALSYFLFTQFSGSKKSKHKKATRPELATEHEAEAAEPPSFISKMGEQMMTQATLLLLTVAKDKLAEYLQSRKGDHENS